MKFSLTIGGAPIPKGRPKFTAHGGFAKAYTPKSTSDYEKQVSKCVSEAMALQSVREPFRGALRVRIAAFFPIPNSASKRDREAMEQGITPMLGRKDVDNIAKALLDAMNGIAYNDDGQVVDLRITKAYSVLARVEISVTEILE